MHLLFHILFKILWHTEAVLQNALFAMKRCIVQDNNLTALTNPNSNRHGTDQDSETKLTNKDPLQTKTKCSSIYYCKHSDVEEAQWTI